MMVMTNTEHIGEKEIKQRAFGVREWLALLAVGLVTAGIFLAKDTINSLEPVGYLSVLIVTLLGNATLILPMPALLFVFAAGSVLPSPLLVGLLAGVGSTLGELTGYLAGLSGSQFVTQSKAYQKIHRRIERRSGLALAVLAFIPSPLFDLAGIAAGALKIKIPVFLTATFICKTLKTLLVAFAGNYSWDWIESLL